MTPERSTSMRAYRRSATGAEAHRRANRKAGARRRAWLDALKAGPCVDCGRSYPPCVMDFDHRDPATKSFEIGDRRLIDKARLLEEIQKCDLVCSNCHRLRTHAA